MRMHTARDQWSRQLVVGRLCVIMVGPVLMGWAMVISTNMVAVRGSSTTRPPINITSLCAISIAGASSTPTKATL